MNMNQISSACLIIFDELKDNKDCQDLIARIDEAENDADIKAGVKEAVKYLEENGKRSLADDIREKTAGWAF